MTRVLFVCLGNICRSPTAEGVFLELLERQGLQDRFVVDSAGTGDWHVGERADPRMRSAAKARGYALKSRARQVAPEDFERFDHIIAMDQRNAEDLKARCPKAALHKISLLRSWSRDDAPDVPDPYYGGPSGFDEVVSIVERACGALLEALR